MPTSPEWTLYCPKSGQLHGNALACGSCLAQNTKHSSRTNTSNDIEIIEISSSPPHPKVSTSIFATSQDSSRFHHYDRTKGAEQHRQSSIHRTKKASQLLSPNTSISAVVHFYLLKQVKNDDGFFVPISCKTLSMIYSNILYLPILMAIDRINVKIKPRTIESLDDFVTNDLLPEMSQNGFVRAPSDQLRLATSVSKLEPTYLPKNANQRQAIEDLILTWFRPSPNSLPGTIYVIIVRETPNPEGNNSDLLPATLEVKSEIRDSGQKIKIEKKESKTKAISPIRKNRLATPLPQTPNIVRKRSFSDAQIESMDDSEDITSPDTLISSLNADFIANRTRNRHILKQEDLDLTTEHN
jgi:hypothetical protein